MVLSFSPEPLFSHPPRKRPKLSPFPDNALGRSNPPSFSDHTFIPRNFRPKETLAGYEDMVGGQFFTPTDLRHVQHNDYATVTTRERDIKQGSLFLPKTSISQDRQLAAQKDTLASQVDVLSSQTHNLVIRTEQIASVLLDQMTLIQNVHKATRNQKHITEAMFATLERVQTLLERSQSGSQHTKKSRPQSSSELPRFSDA